MKHAKIKERPLAQAEEKRRASPPPPTPRRPWWPWLLAALFALFVVFEAYGPALNGAFVFDDSYLPFLKPGMDKAPLRAWLGVRPVTQLSYWLNFQNSGLNPYPYHAVNLLLHWMTALLVVLVCRRLLQWTGTASPLREGLAVFGGLLFLLHPVQTESVAYVAGRSEPLSVLFYFAAFAVFLYRKQLSVSWVQATAILFLLGCAGLSKEHAVTLPALLLLTDLWFPVRPDDLATPIQRVKRNWRIYVPAIGMGALGSVFVLRLIQGASSAGFSLKEFTWYQYLFTQFRMIWHYVRLFFLPVSQNADYTVAISRTLPEHGALLGLLGLLLATAAALRYRKRFPLAAYGWLVFLLMLAPTSSILPIADPLVERRVYLSFIGLLLIALEGLRRVPVRLPVLSASLLAVLAVCAVATYQRSQVWRNPIALWKDVVSKSPSNQRAHFQLGYAYYDSSRCQEALPLFAKAAQIGPEDTRLLVDWGLALDCAGRKQEALPKLQRAVQLDNTAATHASLALVQAKLGQNDDALRTIAHILSLDPNFGIAYEYRANVHLGRGDLVAAEADYRRALELQPGNVAAQQGLAIIAQRRQRG